jgi:hypothetical protein
MKKFVYLLIFFFFISFNIIIVRCMAETKILKRGFYKIEDLKLSSNTKYTVQNSSFNERIYIFILDSTETPIQSIRLWPQSQKYNLFPLQAGYKIIVTGDGELIIS